jgi:Tti2 family
MAQLPSPTIEVVERVLSQHIKPWFSKTPHSLVNPISGRRLRRAAGGPSAAMDMYEDQEWKTAPAIASLLLWCIQQLKVYVTFLGRWYPHTDLRLLIKPEDYENVWHLIVPPTMILIDDYESYYKLKGLNVISELLKHVPPETLKRTGVDGLLISVRQLVAD